MREKHGLRFGPLGDSCVHICVDMQRLFAERTDWFTPWIHRVLPNVERISARYAANTVFTRFIPLQSAGDGEGTWRRYYQTWASMTLDGLGADMVELVPELARLVPPAELLDKRVYSPWQDTDLDQRLKKRGVDTVVVTGGETDVCVLGTVLGAVDRGYRVVIITDALCSSSDEAHDASIALYETRYGQQVETVRTDTLVEAWRP